MGTKGKDHSLSWTLPITFRVIGPNIKHQNCEYLTHYHVVFDEKLSTVDHAKKDTVPGNWKNLVEDHSDITNQENLTIEK